MRKKVKSPDIDKIFEDGRRIDLALKKAARQARLFHKRSGNPIAGWRNGKVVWISPEEIDV